MSCSKDLNNNNIFEFGFDFLNPDKNEIKIKLNSILEKIFAETEDPQLKELFEYVRGIYDYNVLNGKQTRGKLIVMTSKLMAEKSQKSWTASDDENCYILGLVMEIFQAFALIIDDVLDGSQTRRGQLCWYKKVGMQAISDGLILEQHCYEILRQFFGQKPYYRKIFEAFHRSLDMRWSKLSKESRFEKFTESSLECVYKYKTTYYSFVLPVKLGMILNSSDSEEEVEKGEQILLKIGHLFQMKDDFLDCFGDPTLTGKLGTDIADGKCCWPIVSALMIGNERQICVLRDNYGLESEFNVNAVKQVYEDLNLRQLFENESNDLRNYILAEIENRGTFCPEVFKYILSKVI